MDYTPGQVTASLQGGKKKKKSKTSNSLLDQLFSKKTEKVEKKPEQKEATPKPTPPNGKKINSVSSINHLEKAGAKRKVEAFVKTPEIKKTKKESNSTPVNQSQDPVNNDFPFVHETLQQKSSAQQPKEKKVKKSKKLRNEEGDPVPRKRQRRDETADNRTIFIGNCPLSADKKVMRKLFMDFGPIESIRFRCGPTNKPDLPRRAVIIKKEFHENAQSYVCFIVFKQELSAFKALKLNGHVLEDLHLRVDIAANSKKHDKKRSVFVGNLPLSIKEEHLRSHFESCGTILNVRVVRDRETSIGKGIAYVHFKSKDGVLEAKKLNDTALNGRKLRVMPCKKKEKKISSVESKESTDTDPKKKRIAFAPSNRKTAKSFHEILSERKEKRLQKGKKNKQVSKKSDGLSSIFGDISADMKKLKMGNSKQRTKTAKDHKGKKLDMKGKKTDWKGKKTDMKGKKNDWKGKRDNKFQKKSR